MQVEQANSFLNEDILKVFEKQWGFGIPGGYRKFLLEFNGGYTEKTFFNFKNSNNGSALHGLFGIRCDSNLSLLSYKCEDERYPTNTIPIGNDVCGNRILLSVKGADRGKVYFWDHEREADTDKGEVADYSNLTLIADSFEEFINSLKSEEEMEKVDNSLL